MKTFKIKLRNGDWIKRDCDKPFYLILREIQQEGKYDTKEILSVEVDV